MLYASQIVFRCFSSSCLQETVIKLFCKECAGIFIDQYLFLFRDNQPKVDLKSVLFFSEKAIIKKKFHATIKQEYKNEMGKAKISVCMIGSMGAPLTFHMLRYLGMAVIFP